jgi:arylsulfatase A-like enzyme
VHEKFLHYRGVENLSWETWSEAVAKYFGFVTFIDDQIGRILDAVDEHLDADNTVVVHAADHGDFTGSHRQFNKGPMMYEEIYHIPLLIRWPDVIEPGSSCDEFVRLLDLMPTFLDIADIEPPEDIDGRRDEPTSGRMGADSLRPSIQDPYNSSILSGGMRMRYRCSIISSWTLKRPVPRKSTAMSEPLMRFTSPIP